jgi:hypothetical protein
MLPLNFSPSRDVGVCPSTSPREIYLVRSHAGQHLNFEFIIANGTDDKLALNKIELSVLDDSGKLVRREFYDDYARPALELRPTRTLRSDRRMTVFNPFHTFAPDRAYFQMFAGVAP